MRKIAVLTVLMLGLLACRFGAQSATSQPTQPVQATLADPTVFVGQPTIEPGNYELSLGSEGDQRDVILHLPPAYDGSLDLPLLIVLHGGGGSGAQIQRHTQLDADADEYGFVVAYPNGSGPLEDAIFTWNVGHCCGYAFENNVDDVAFISLLIDRLVEHYAIDPSRVYLAGISNGGMMAYRAGAELADKVAAIAPIAASIGGQSAPDNATFYPPQPSGSVAVIAFHGMEDQHVLYEGGIGPMAITDGRSDLPVAESIGFWVEANGCDPVPSTEEQAKGNILIDTYSECDGGADVVLVSIVDGGHAWPGGRQRLVGDDPTQDISANRMMLEFFLAHSK
jgi:polyhydroxybutyrate depolymerase